MAWEGVVGAGPRVRDKRDRPGVGAPRSGSSGRSMSGTGPSAVGSPRRSSVPLRARAPATRRSRSPRASSRREHPRWTALAFQFASTNLVWELGLVLWVLIGWQFTARRVPRRDRDDRADERDASAALSCGSLEEQARVRTRRQADSGHQHHSAGAEMSLARTALVGRLGLVGRRTQLPWRLADAVAGDRARLPDRGLRRPTRQRLLQRPLPPPTHPGRSTRSRTWSSVRDRGPQVRVLGRQRAAGRGPVVGRDLLRGRVLVPVRGPDRAADRARSTASITAGGSPSGSPR